MTLKKPKMNARLFFIVAYTECSLFVYGVQVSLFWGRVFRKPLANLQHIHNTKISKEFYNSHISQAFIDFLIFRRANKMYILVALNFT